MDAKLCAQTMSVSLNLVRRRVSHTRRHPSVVSVLKRAEDDATGETTQTGVFKDNWFDLLAINYLSKNVQAASGVHNRKSGYESLVDAAFGASRIFDPMQQRQLVIQALERAFPKPILTLIRTLLPQSKFAREYFAAFTTLFFAWLVGPCEILYIRKVGICVAFHFTKNDTVNFTMQKVKESDSNGGTEKNIVQIKKCRFLEETNCVGMCLNLCKIPSQSFIKDNLGMPVNMVPNYEDKSCEMVFGQEPPAENIDQAFNQACYKQCKRITAHSIDCPG